MRNLQIGLILLLAIAGLRLPGATLNYDGQCAPGTGSPASGGQFQGSTADVGTLGLHQWGTTTLQIVGDGANPTGCWFETDLTRAIHLDFGTGYQVSIATTYSASIYGFDNSAIPDFGVGTAIWIDSNYQANIAQGTNVGAFLFPSGTAAGWGPWDLAVLQPWTGSAYGAFNDIPTGDYTLHMKFAIFLTPPTPLDAAVAEVQFDQLGSFNVVDAATPEPATWPVMVLALAGLGALLRRRRTRC
jgi:hypothetical protein